MGRRLDVSRSVRPNDGLTSIATGGAAGGARRPKLNVLATKLENRSSGIIEERRWLTERIRDVEPHGHEAFGSSEVRSRSFLACDRNHDQGAAIDQIKQDRFQKENSHATFSKRFCSRLTFRRTRKKLSAQRAPWRSKTRPGSSYSTWPSPTSSRRSRSTTGSRSSSSFPKEPDKARHELSREKMHSCLYAPLHRLDVE